MICLKRKPLPHVALALLCACASASAQNSHRRRAEAAPGARAPVVFLDSTRERDGLKGPVRRVETEVARVERRGGALVEKSRSVLERTLYDEMGRRAENETYPVVSAPSGREFHSYDAQGNLSETVVRDARGATLSRAAYAYEFDSFGNWVKMTASLAVVGEGRIEYEPFEITKRRITYYLLDDRRGAEAPAPATDAEPAKAGGNEEESGLRRADTARRREAAQRGAVKGETGDLASPPGGAKPREGERVAHAQARAVSLGVLNDRATWLPSAASPVAGKRLEKPVTISVDVVVDPTGRVVEARAEGGAPAIRQAAEDAARRATFMPYYSEGHPASVRGWINFGFYFAP
ncbi:MAG: hypothetical protein ABR563_02835 [Pyrinomonadaceae bacterium]